MGGPSISKRSDLWTILALWGAGLGAAGQYAKVSVVFDKLPQLFPKAGAEIGFAVSLVGLVGIVFGVVAGLVVARLGFRWALIWALWLGALLSILQSLVPPWPVFLALRGVEGVSHLAVVVAAPTLIAQLSPPAMRGLALTLWGTFFGVSFALLAWLGLPLVARFGVPALFLAHGLYLALFAVILTLRLPRLGLERPAPLTLGDMLRRHATLYRSPRMSAPGIGWLFYTFCFVSILTVLPPLIPQPWRAFTVGAFPLVSIAVSLTLGVWLLRHRPAVWVVQVGFGLSLLSVLWLGYSPGSPAACLALAAALGLIQGASFAAVPQLNPGAGEQAQANGAMAQMGNLGNTLGTPVMAAALFAMGPVALPILTGAALAMGMIAHILLARARAQG